MTLFQGVANFFAPRHSTAWLHADGTLEATSFYDIKPTQLYFHCSNTKKVFVDQRGAVVDGPAEARDYATPVVQSFTNERSLDDWRDWILHVSDDQGNELFVVPFVFVLRLGAQCCSTTD